MKTFVITLDDYKIIKKKLKEMSEKLLYKKGTGVPLVNVSLDVNANPVSKNRCYYSELEPLSEPDEVLQKTVACDIDDLTFETCQILNIAKKGR